MLIQLNIFLSLAISFFIAYLVIPKIVKVSGIKKLFDVPNHRSASKKIVPTLGGIAIFAGFAISLIVSANNINIDELKYMFASLTIMFLMGLKDDIIGLSAKKKLYMQFIISLYLVILGNYRITNLHGILGFEEIGYFISIIISVVIVVGIINAFNLIDGIDGLSSGICILVSFAYSIWFLNVGDFLYALICFSLIGSLAAFFLYNVFGKTNKIFMGDTGSLVLGTIMAILTIHFNEFQPTLKYAPHGLPAVSLAIIIVPVIDTIRIFAIRISQKRSPFSPDMGHIHHNILRLTHNHLATSIIIIAVNGLIILFSWMLIDVIGDDLLFILLLVTGFILAAIPSYIIKYQDNKIGNKVKENKSVFAISIFLKKLKD